jgi:hypothetical protein
VDDASLHKDPSIPRVAAAPPATRRSRYSTKAGSSSKRLRIHSPRRPSGVRNPWSVFRQQDGSAGGQVKRRASLSPPDWCNGGDAPWAVGGPGGVGDARLFFH